MRHPRQIVVALSASRSAVLLVLLLCTFGYSSSHFFTRNNLNSVLIQATFIGCIAIAMAIAFIGREFDLSVGSMMAISGFVAVRVADIDPALAFAAAIGTGAACGLANGIIVGVLRVNAFIATLGTLSIISGLTLLVSNQQAVGTSSLEFLELATKDIGPVPVFAVIFAALAIVAHCVLEYTPVGLTLRALGNNSEFCRLNGVPVVRYRIGIFVLTGIGSGLSGAMTASWVGGADPNAGQNIPLLVISAVILGGVSLYGGLGTIPQAVGGVFVLTVFVDGMTLLNVSPYYQTFLEGVVLVAVVVVAALLHPDAMTKSLFGSLRLRVRTAWSLGARDPRGPDGAQPIGGGGTDIL